MSFQHSRVNKPELDAQLVAENIALQLARSVSAAPWSVDSALRFAARASRFAFQAV
jgi:small subunit ribosomal protein S3